MDSRDVAKVKELWGESSGRWGSEQWLRWLQHPNVQERINALATGEQGRDRFHYLVDKYFPRQVGTTHRVKRALTLGCGHGEFERGVAGYDLAEIHDACDIADGAVSAAARLAREAGLSHIRYKVADLNTIQLPRRNYDVVFGISSIHHVASLEHVFAEVVETLVPGGYFVLDEFIGPSKFQWTNDQLDAINTELQRMPMEFRRGLAAPFIPKGAVRRPSIAEMNAGDPSEAARSSEILDVLAQSFEIVEFRGYGGSLLHLLLDEIAGRFAPDNPQAMGYLRHLFELEDRLIAAGTLRHDFAVIVAQPKARRQT